MHIGRPRSSAGGRDDGGGALRWRAAALDGELAGAKAIRRCGAPKAAGTAPQRPGARGEPHGGHPERRQRGAAVTRRATAAAELRRRRAGDAEHGRPNQQHRWAPYLTAVPLGSSKATERRRASGTGAATLDGLGFGAAAAGARVHGRIGGRTRRGGGLNRRRKRRWLAGPSTGSCGGQTRVRPRVGDGRRREVAADERGPGVSDRGDGARAG
jgi:hypothetical protein